MTKPVIRTLEDTALNDSDKTVTVPTGEVREVVSIAVQLITTATAGNRQMVVQFLDGGSNLLYSAEAGAVQAASLTRTYHFVQGVPDDAAFATDNSIRIQLPENLKLLPTHQVRVFDQAAIAAAADDMEVRYVNEITAV